jgi:hypothetical protein
VDGKPNTVRESLNKVVIRARDREGDQALKLLNSWNSQIIVDGVELQCVESFHLRLEKQSFAVLTVSMVAEVEVDAAMLLRKEES